MIDNTDPLDFVEQLIVPIATYIFVLILICGCMWLLWKAVT